LPADRRTHPLESFIRQTFGDQFGKVVLAGYGRGAGISLRLRLSVATEGKGVRGRTLEISGDLPHGREPLVLAALLKLLLSRGYLSAELEFVLPEVIGALGKAVTPGVPGEVDRVIRKYLGLSYMVRREGGGESGMYALVTSYDRDDEFESGVKASTSSALRAHFHPGFVEGLKASRVVFAGIDFGRLSHVP
jgi:hypothetical protein